MLTVRDPSVHLAAGNVSAPAPPPQLCSRREPANSREACTVTTSSAANPREASTPGSFTQPSPSHQTQLLALAPLTEVVSVKEGGSGPASEGGPSGPLSD